MLDITIKVNTTWSIIVLAIKIAQSKLQKILYFIIRDEYFLREKTLFYENNSI